MLRLSGGHGWLHLSWDEPTAHRIRGPLQALSQLPGVSVRPLGASVPANARTTPQARALLDLVDGSLAPLPPPPELPSLASLYPHQQQAAHFLLEQRGGLLADAMGLGKTAVALCVAEALRRTTQRPVLIVAPRYTRATWQGELVRLGLLHAERDWCALQTRDLTSTSFDPEAWWYFVHYEIVQAWWSRFATSVRRPCVGIADEAHLVRNARTQRGHGAQMSVGSCPVRLVLTGTPVVNRLSDLWHLLTLASGQGSWGSPLAFRKRYCGAQYTGYGHVDGGLTHGEELHERLSHVLLRRTLDGAGVRLPPLTRTLVVADLDEASASAHAQQLRAVDIHALCDDLVSGRMRSEVLRALTELRTLTGRAKLAVTAQLVAALREDAQNVVVFGWQRRTLTTLGRHLESSGAGPVRVVTGAQPQRERDGLVERFQQEGGVLLASYDTLQAGVTLHAARHVVLHDLHWTPASVLQAEARVHRIGQTRPCLSHWVVARDSIDTLFARVLLDKAHTLDIAPLELGLRAALGALELQAATGMRSVAEQLHAQLQRWASTPTH